MTTIKDITAVILSGGASSRIGKNKAFLKIDDKIIDFFDKIRVQILKVNKYGFF